MSYQICISVLLSIGLFAICCKLLHTYYLRKVKCEKEDIKITMITVILFVIVSLILIFYGKNIILFYILFLIFSGITSIYFINLISKNKNVIDDDFNIIFANTMSFLINILILEIQKLNSDSLEKSFVEIFLLTFIIEIIVIKMLSNQIVKERIRKETNRVLGICAILYILYVICINPDYLYVKFISAIFLIILTLIYTFNKFKFFIKYIFLFISFILGVFVIFLVYESKINSEVLATSVKRIYVNQSKNELIKYKNGDRFIFYDEEKIKNNDKLIIYEVVNDNGQDVIKEDRIISDFVHEKYDILGESWYLEETTEKIMITNNNRKKDKKSYYDYTYYYLYCD